MTTENQSYMRKHTQMRSERTQTDITEVLMAGEYTEEFIIRQVTPETKKALTGGSLIHWELRHNVTNIHISKLSILNTTY